MRHVRPSFLRAAPAREQPWFGGTRPNISECHSEISARVPFCIARAKYSSTRPNISESHSEISTRVPLCITWTGLECPEHEVSLNVLHIRLGVPLGDLHRLRPRCHRAAAQHGVHARSPVAAATRLVGLGLREACFEWAFCRPRSALNGRFAGPVPPAVAE